MHQRVVSVVASWRTAWVLLKAHPVVSWTVFVATTTYGAWAWFTGDSPWAFILRVFAVVRGMTVAHAWTIGAGVAAALCGAALVMAFYERAANAAALALRVRELEEEARRLRVNADLVKMERDQFRGEVEDLRREVAAHPSAINQLKVELQESLNQVAQAEMEKLVCHAELKGLTVSVVVRFVEYADSAVADGIAGYIRGFAPWNVEVRHEAAHAIRRQFGSSQVEITSAPGPFVHCGGILAFALARSRALRGRVHFVSGETGGVPVMITVFPMPKGD